METKKTVEEILAIATKANGTDSRLKRLNSLNDLNIRLKAWLTALHARKKGPSLMEMGLIVEDIEKMLEVSRSMTKGNSS